MEKGRASVIEERGMKVVGRSRIEKREIAGAGFGGGVIGRGRWNAKSPAGLGAGACESRLWNRAKPRAETHLKLPLLSFRWPWTPPPPAGSLFISVDISAVNVRSARRGLPRATTREESPSPRICATILMSSASAALIAADKC